jgi:hypothetical protein
MGIKTDSFQEGDKDLFPQKSRNVQSSNIIPDKVTMAAVLTVFIISGL